ncbi:DNA cytosine methyltransferase [Pseudomonas sp. ENNP23]|uniref:DNA cytosine methyltransferase n=1 Tax=Pseudomonas sp. ENNP23 TaxID=1535636 RepID=UPI00084AE06A|nr:DNA cytosine methyltransferase [Pseudomonas sp. ENNP23]OEC59476.1 DNA (cytosine-5-)-methyltransferase [Pseudomonas sp. ENNP23]
MTCAIDYGSICSGIEAASMAWECLGFTPRWFAEIEPFPSAVLAHRWPDVPNLGDMTKLAREVLLGNIAAPLILVGGTPCQDFSVAGMRKGLAGERGALTIKFVELADAIDHVRPAGDECVVLWENVPGVLSDKGNAFGCFLGALVGESDALQPSGGKWTDAGCVYGPRRAAAWRVLDAQYFGLAQRRRRVFVVASARNGFDPAAVLFESGGVRRDSAPSRGAAEEVARRTACGTHGDGGDPGRQEAGRASTQAFGGGKNCNPTDVSTAVTAHPGGRYDLDAETFVVAPTLAGGGRKAGGYSYDDIPAVAATLTAQYGKNGGIPAGNDCNPVNLIAGTLNAGTKAAGSATQQDAHAGLLVAHALDARQSDVLQYRPIAGPLDTGIPGATAMIGSQVRRLTPRECERLQGFPDDYTLIPWRGRPAEECPDGPRYKAIGNSKAVPVVRWIGRRLLRQLGAA